MEQKDNQDRPPANQPVERNQLPFDTSGRRYGGRGDRWTPPPTGDGGGGNGGWIKVILVTLVAIIIFCGYSYYSKNSTDTQVGILTGQMADYPAKVSQAINSVNAAIAGIPNSITTQVNSAVDSKISAIQSQINTITSDIVALKTQITNIQNQITSIPSYGTDIADIKSKIDTMQNQIFSLSAEIQKLKDILNASDIQHKAISVELNNYSNFGEVNISGNNVTTCANITLTIRNDSSNSIKLKNLEISLNPYFDDGELSGFNRLAIQYTGLRVVSPSMNFYRTGVYALNLYDVVINIPNWVINAGATRTITLKYYVYMSYQPLTATHYTNDEIKGMIYYMSIFPDVTMISYTLG